jgi:GTP-binding protein
MAFANATFITSAPALSDCPVEGPPEVCFAGRSNVGKSSLINAITNRRKLARTSNTPGKTQQMNYYEIRHGATEPFYLIDLPGFGFAKVPAAVRKQWGRDIREYLQKRDTLRLIIHLVDSRYPPTALDEEFFYWMATNDRPFAVCVTKMDKLSANQSAKATRQVESVLEEMNIDVPVLAVSSDHKVGLDDLQSLILEFVSDL